MSRPANVATGKCRDRQMSRPANVATGKSRDRQNFSRQMSRSANVAIGKCRDRQMSRSAKVRPARCRPALGRPPSFALRGKFSQLDFNQFNFCRQRLCMGDLFFEQGIACLLYICFTKVFSKVRTCFESLKKMEFSNQFSAVVKNLVF